MPVLRFPDYFRVPDIRALSRDGSNRNAEHNRFPVCSGSHMGTGGRFQLKVQETYRGRIFTMFFEDLSPCLYVASSFAEGKKLKAVGWLAWGHPYTLRQLQLPETRFGQLLRLLVNPWEPFCFMGSHDCEFCPEKPLQVSHGGDKGCEGPLVTGQVVDGVEIERIHSHKIERDGLVVHFGANNLYVPADGCVYVAPSMISHYVDVHSYEPPAVFWEAVMNCPEMGSETYRQALIANGSLTEDWVRAVQAG
jgi:hypothetical protein